MLWVRKLTAATAKESINVVVALYRDEGEEQFPHQPLLTQSLQNRALSASVITDRASSDLGNTSTSSPQGMYSSPTPCSFSWPQGSPRCCGMGEAA